MRPRFLPRSCYAPVSAAPWPSKFLRPRTKTGFPLLADVCEQLDGEEIVSAPDVTVGLGEAFDLLDTSDWEIKNADAIVIELHDAAADDLTPFSTDVPGTYTAWYVVTPVSGHPAYEISRKILVEQLQTALPSEEGGAPGFKRQLRRHRG